MGERSVDTGSIHLDHRRGRRGRPSAHARPRLHGSEGRLRDFLLPLAERGWHVVAPDLRGHGASDKPDDEGAYTLPIFAGDVFALADTLGWNRFTLLGHSMGGMIAQHMLLGGARPHRSAHPHGHGARAARGSRRPRHHRTGRSTSYAPTASRPGRPRRKRRPPRSAARPTNGCGPSVPATRSSVTASCSPAPRRWSLPCSGSSRRSTTGSSGSPHTRLRHS